MPEIVLDEPRSIRAILDATGRSYRRHPLLFATLALAVMGPYDLAVPSANTLTCAISTNGL